MTAAEPPPTAFGHSGRRKWGEIGVVLGLVVALLAALWWGGRVLAGVLADKLPYSVDRQIGASVAASVLEEHTTCQNPELTAAVQSIVSRLGTGLDPELLPLEVHVLESETVNAFALPGGHIFVLTGLLQAIQSPEELIGVLGHEMGHIVDRHGIRRLAQQVWLSFVLNQLFGDVSGLAAVFEDAAGDLLALQFGRDQEREADDFGLQLMASVGIPPGDFPAFFERMPQDGPPEWFSTHPSPEDRADELRARSSALPAIDDPWEVPLLEVLRGECTQSSPRVPTTPRAP